MSAAPTTEVKPAPPAIEKIKVKVDGREVEVPKLSPDHAGSIDLKESFRPGHATQAIEPQVTELHLAGRLDADTGCAADFAMAGGRRHWSRRDRSPPRRQSRLPRSGAGR